MMVQRARSMYWKKWTAKHKQEELKEGAWIGPALALLRKKAKGFWTEKHRNVASRIFDEKKTIRLAGRMSVNAKLASGGRHREAQAPPLPRMVRGSDVRSQRLATSGSKRRERRRKNGSGKEAQSRTLSVKVNGIQATSV